MRYFLHFQCSRGAGRGRVEFPPPADLQTTPTVPLTPLACFETLSGAVLGRLRVHETSLCLHSRSRFKKSSNCQYTLILWPVLHGDSTAHVAKRVQIITSYLTPLANSCTLNTVRSYWLILNYDLLGCDPVYLVL